METNQKCGDGLTGTQKETALRALIQRTGYHIHQVGVTTVSGNRTDAAVGLWDRNTCLIPL